MLRNNTLYNPTVPKSELEEVIKSFTQAQVSVKIRSKSFMQNMKYSQQLDSFKWIHLTSRRGKGGEEYDIYWSYLNRYFHPTRMSVQSFHLQVPSPVRWIKVVYLSVARQTIQQQHCPHFSPVNCHSSRLCLTAAQPIGCWRLTKSPGCNDSCSKLMDNHKQSFWLVIGHHTGAINTSGRNGIERSAGMRLEELDATTFEQWKERSMCGYTVYSVKGI